MAESKHGSGNVRVDKVLTNLSIRLSPEGFVADTMCPRIKVNKQSDKIKVYDKSHMRNRKTLIGDDGMTPRWSWGFESDKSYHCEGYGLFDVIGWRESKNADNPINLRKDTMLALSEVMKIDRELRLATAYLNTNNVGDSETLSGTARWSDYENGVSDPITDIKTGVTKVRENSGKIPNVMCLDWKTAITLAAHPSMVDVTSVGKPTSKAAVLKVLEDMFAIKPVIAGAMYDSSTYGGTVSLSPIWGADVFIGYIDPKPGLRTYSFGYTFDWKPGLVVYTWDSDNPRGKAISNEETGLDEKIIISGCGYLIKAAIA